MQKGLEATSQFIVPRGEAAKLLESIEESIDQVSRVRQFGGKNGVF